MKAPEESGKRTKPVKLEVNAVDEATAFIDDVCWEGICLQRGLSRLKEAFVLTIRDKSS